MFRVQKFSAELFSELLGEPLVFTSILYEEPCDNLLIAKILFFICKKPYNVKDNDVTRHVLTMVVTASKISKSYVINQFLFQRSNFTILKQESLTKSQ